MKPRLIILPTFLAVILLLCMLMLFFVACEKQGTDCYECIKTAVRVNVTQRIAEEFPADTSYSCDCSEADAEAFESRFNNLYERGTCNDEIIWQKCKCELIK